MPIKLNDIKDIATILKMKYGKNLHEMNFVFCFKKDVDSYFIFQEIQGMPIKRVVYHESNNSVSFVASWASWSNPFALVSDANGEKIEQWEDLLDRGRSYNSPILSTGGFPTSWKSSNKQNKKEKDKKHKNKSDTFVEFRIDKITRAAFNEWGFELYSPTISMIGFKRRSSFPYSIEGVEQIPLSAPALAYPSPALAYPLYNNYSNTIDDDDEDDDDDDGEEPINISWQGGSFHVPEFENNLDGPSQISTGNMIGGCDLSSYWDAEEHDPENDKFDEELGNYFLDEREDDENILDVGQKEIDLYFED